MKIILTKNQYGVLTESKLIVEGVMGIDEFMDDLDTYHHKLLTPEFIQKIKNDIEASNCEKIEWGGFTIPAAGLSLPHGVLLNNMLLGKVSLPLLLFIIFHEIGHQHQYRKYGEEFALKIYQDDIDMSEAIRIMKNTESVADQFSLRKCREFSKLGMLDITKLPKAPGYENMDEKGFTDYVNMIKNKIKESGLTSSEEIGTMMYNWIKIM